MNTRTQSISKSVLRPDAKDKAEGRTLFTKDYPKAEGMLYVFSVRSVHQRAEIIEIKPPIMPEGYSFITAETIKQAGAFNRTLFINDDWRILAENEVRHKGEVIALICGENPLVLSELVKNTVVRYNVQKPVTGIKSAKESTDNIIFGTDNSCASYSFGRGDVETVFKNAPFVLERVFETGLQEQLYLEPQVLESCYDSDVLIIKGSMQCPYYVKKSAKHAFGLDDEQIHIVQHTTGGAFGGKEDIPSILGLQAAICSMVTKKPCRIALDRKEDMEFTPKRHPSLCHYRIATDDRGNMLALSAHIEIAAGAFTGISPVVLQRALFAAAGVYDFPVLRISGKAYITNNPSNGAFRGFGAPQSVFAIERMIDLLAERFNECPAEYRRRHFIKKGGLTSTNGTVRQDIKLSQMLDECMKQSGFLKKRHDFSALNESVLKRQSQERKLHGIGLSVFPHGCGFTGKGEENIKGTAGLRANKDGSYDILVSNVEMGQGAQTTLRKIVCEVLGIGIERINYDNPDTRNVPDTGPTVASRTCIIVGGLLYDLALEMKEKQKEGESLTLYKTYRHPAFVTWDQDRMEGDAYPVYAYGVNIVETETDADTLATVIKDVRTVFDTGTPIDDIIIEGQIQGGMAQGLGYGLLENMVLKDGLPYQKTMTDYAAPTTMDLPDIGSSVMPVPYEYGPFGAKCAGELTLIGAAPALANAVDFAVKPLGVEIDSIPVTPESIFEKLMKKNVNDIEGVEKRGK
jgi:CO/xanthine dehydrogenase Mo-binding subunit